MKPINVPCVIFLVVFLMVTVGKGLGQAPYFLRAVTYNSGSQSEAVAVADVNGDGKPDLVVANRCFDINCYFGGVGVLLGNGDGTFQPVRAYSSGGDIATAVAVADVNRDGIPDLLVANYCNVFQSCPTGAVSVLLGNGDGTFQPAQIYLSGDTYAMGVSVADVNSDGIPDLLVSNYGHSSPPGGNVGVLLGNGDGTFQTAHIYASGGGVSVGLAVADVNGDGKPDLVVPTLDGFVAVLLGNGDGTFQTARNYSSGGSEPSVAVGDMNGDGKPDLVVASYCIDCPGSVGLVGVLLGNGDGTFKPVQVTGTFQPSGNNLPIPQIALGDFNGDGKLDVAIGDGAAMFLGNGDGTFQSPIPLGLGFDGAGAAVGDFNRDGNLDLAVTGGIGNDVVAVLVNVGPPYFHVSITGSPQQPLTTDGSGNFVAKVTITNTGDVTISSVQVTSAALGSGTMLSPISAVTNLAPGASIVVTLTFPPNSVQSGTTTAPLKVSGTYSVTSPTLGGNWALSFRKVTL